MKTTKDQINDELEAELELCGKPLVREGLREPKAELPEFYVDYRPGRTSARTARLPRSSFLVTA